MPDEFFEEDSFYTGPRVNERLIQDAEEALAVRLPAAYVELLRQRNGGVPKRRCFPTQFLTSWATDHFEIRALLGVGGRMGIDSGTGQGSRDLINEWGYPDIGVVVCDMPSGGHDAVMLDYSACGPTGEPTVAYIDEDREPRHVASSFSDFIRRLESCQEPDA